MQGNNIRSLVNIPEYKITKVMNKDSEIHLWIDPHKRKKAVCSGCGQTHQSGYHSQIRVIAEDLKLGSKRVFLHILKRRHHCPILNKIMTEKISWIEKGARVTKAFSKQVYRLSAITTNKEAGWYLELDGI